MVYMPFGCFCDAVAQLMFMFYYRLLKIQWKQDLQAPISLIKQAIDIDEKCEYAYEILGTIEVQR